MCLFRLYESMVSFVSRCYIRGQNGEESLMVCLMCNGAVVCLGYSNKKTKCPN